MAFSSAQQVFLTAEFESKARGIFGIPVHYYLPNAELEYYYSLLRVADSDADAQLGRVLTCATNPSCRCFFCQELTDDGRSAQGETSDSGDFADDEAEPSHLTTPSSSILQDSHEDTSASGEPEEQGTSIWSADTSSTGSIVAGTPVQSTGTPSVASASDASIICVGEDSAPSPIVISDDSQQFSSPSVTGKESQASSSLQDLEQVWNSTFRSEGEDTVEWATPAARKRPRRALTYLKVVAKRVRVLPPLHVSPIRPAALTSDQSWNSEDGHRRM